MATAQTLLANVLILFLNTATGVLIARGLGPHGRGEQAAMVMWPQFLAGILTLGIPSALLYNMKRHPGEARGLFSAALILSAVLGTLAAIAGAVILPFYLTQYSPAVVRVAQGLMAVTPTTLVAFVLMAALQAREEFSVYNRVRYLSPVITLVALVGALGLGHLTPFVSSAVFCFAGTPVFLWLLSHVCRLYRPVLLPPAHAAYKRLIGYGVRSYGIDVLGMLSGTLDQVLVVGLLAPGQMGLYTVALSLSRMLNVLPTAVISVLFPKASARPVAEVVALTGRAARVSALLTTMGGGVLLIVSPLVLRLLYGADYLGAVTVFRVLMIEAILGSTVWVLGQAFMALDRPGTVTLLQGVGLALSVPLLLVLIPRFGLLGAGMAILISTLARLIFVLAAYRQFLHVPAPGLLITRADIVWLRRRLLPHPTDAVAAAPISSV